MAQFGVSAVRWNNDQSEVEECRVHTIAEINGFLWLSGGAAYRFAQLAEVAAVGNDEIWFLLIDDSGFARKYAPMIVKNEGGRPLTANDEVLGDLPTY